MKHFAFHCNTSRSGNYRYLSCGANQSDAIQKLSLFRQNDIARNGVCVSECESKWLAESAKPRIA